MPEAPRNTLLQPVLPEFLHCVAPAMALSSTGRRHPEAGTVVPEKHKIGRERPHFFGFQPPKKIVGSLPPSRHADACLGS
jgi:hypothetical protein